jgi:hypothetical protein
LIDVLVLVLAADAFVDSAAAACVDDGVAVADACLMLLQLIKW